MTFTEGGIIMNAKLMGFLGALWALQLGTAHTEPNQNKLQWVDCYHNRTSFQVMFDFAQPFSYTKMVNADENAIIVSFPGMKIVNFNPKDVTTTLAKLIERQLIREVTVTEEHDKVVLSLYFPTERDLPEKTVPNKLVVGFRKINDQRNHKLIIDICPNEMIKSATIQYAQSSAIQSDYTELVPSHTLTQKNKEDWRIIIDPGHGGKDTGASSASGIKEKDVALRIARALAKKLAEQGYNAHLTRSSDTYLSLLERTAFAHQLNADLFVSIHLNSAGTAKPANNGIETFYMHNPAVDENNQMRDYIFINQDANKNLINRAEKLLKDTHNGSKQLASNIQDNLLSTLERNNCATNNRGIKPENYRIILRNTIPTALVEVGFLTNYNEARLLASPSYQNLIAEGIFDGIKQYTEVSGQ